MDARASLVLGEQGAVTEFHKIWIAQCKAARSIRTRWGSQMAIGYLIGEKPVEFMRVAERAPEWRAQFPMFVAEINWFLFSG